MKVKIIKVASYGEEFEPLTPGSIHEVVDPPKAMRKKFSNTGLYVWVMGKTEPVRIFIHGRDKEAVIIKQ